MQLLVYILGTTVLWDAFTTFYGSYILLSIANENPIKPILLSILFMSVILGFLLATPSIWGEKRGFIIDWLLRFFWIIAFLYDLYTSYHGNQNFIFSNTIASSQQIMLIGITILISSTPIVFSYLYGDEFL